jgi:WbqC-like protein family
VQYDKHGWRNRNQIKTAQGKQWLTIPVHSAGVTQGIPIKDVKIDWSKPWAVNHWKSLSMSYAKAPYFRQYAGFLEPFYQREDVYLADFTIDLTMALARELGISHTRFMRSSSLEGIDGQKTGRLIQILTRVGTTHYISGPSAQDYIEQDQFDSAGISLEYMKYDYGEYAQLYPPFEPQVSALDLLFMTGPEAPNHFIKRTS